MIVNEKMVSELSRKGRGKRFVQKSGRPKCLFLALKKKVRPF